MGVARATIRVRNDVEGLSLRAAASFPREGAKRRSQGCPESRIRRSSTNCAELPTALATDPNSASCHGAWKGA